MRQNSFGDFLRSPYAYHVITPAEPQRIRELIPGQDSFRCPFVDATDAEIPAFLGRFLRPHDQLALLSPANTEVLIWRQSLRARPQQFRFAKIGYVSRPKPRDGAGFFVRAELPTVPVNAGTCFWRTALSGDIFTSSTAKTGGLLYT